MIQRLGIDKIGKGDASSQFADLHVLPFHDARIGFGFEKPISFQRCSFFHSKIDVQLLQLESGGNIPVMLTLVGLEFRT